MGFASTHSDLAKNSISKETKSIQLDTSFDSANVMIFMVTNYETLTSFEIEATKVIAKQFTKQVTQSFYVQHFRLVFDVGWYDFNNTYNFTSYQEQRANHNKKLKAQIPYTFINRRARDGLTS